MKINKLAVFIVGVTLLFTAGITALAINFSKTAEVETSSQTKITLNKSSHDWSTIGINDGKVNTTFEVKNSGTEILKLYNPTTSCTCTTAQLKLGEIKSPIYSMHTKSDFILEVKPGETGLIEVIYDPLFHGPSGVGEISRSVTVLTNSSSQPTLTFNLSATVTK